MAQHRTPPQPHTIALGERLRTLRDTKGWAQSYVAEQVNITQQAYALYEAGAILQIPSPAIFALAHLYDISPIELFRFYATMTVVDPMVVIDPVAMTPMKERHSA